MIRVEKYSGERREEWNRFIEQSRTPVFQFSRNYMEYHQHRFVDHSMLVYEGDVLKAVVPANIRDNVIYSHQGLTFGGFIVQTDEYVARSLRYFSAFMKHLSEAGITKVMLKQSPSFYSRVSQDDIDYALFLCGSRMVRYDIAFAIKQKGDKIVYQERRKRAVKKALRSGIMVVESSDFGKFWSEILTPNLMSRFGVAPVHSIEEITYLRDMNPGCIRLFEAYLGGQLMAGTVVYETPLVAHAQYISASDEGRQNGAIDLLFDRLINETFRDKEYFDFGIVNEQEGRKVNKGLLDWKEGFGARAFAHRFYEIDTSAFVYLEQSLQSASGTDIPTT